VLEILEVLEALEVLEVLEMLDKLRKACHIELSVRKTSIKRTLRLYTISAYTAYATRLIAID